MYKTTVLPNGLRVVMVPQEGARSVAVLAIFGTGSKYENKENSGISHFLEHMMFKGTKKRPNTMAIAEFMDNIGGIYNAFTGEDYTGYWAKVDYTKIDSALDFVSDLSQNATFDAEELERERGVIIEEINMYYDNPMSHASLLWTQLLHGDQPAGWDIAGTKETVTNITREQMVDYFGKQYTAKNCVISIAGKFDEGEVLKKIEQYFIELPISKAKEKSEVKEDQKEPQILVFNRPTDQTHLLLGFRAYNMKHKDRYVQSVLTTILGGMMSSRMFLNVRERQGLCYYISTMNGADPDTGFITTKSGLDNKRIAQAIQSILKEYKNMIDEPVSEAELKKAKENMKGRMMLSLESSDARASYYAFQELLEGKISTPEDEFKNIDAVTAKDIQNFAREVFTNENLNLVVVGPHKEDAFKDIFEI